MLDKFRDVAPNGYVIGGLQNIHPLVEGSQLERSHLKSLGRSIECKREVCRAVPVQNHRADMSRIAADHSETTARVSCVESFVDSIVAKHKRKKIKTVH